MNGNPPPPKRSAPPVRRAPVPFAPVPVIPSNAPQYAYPVSTGYAKRTLCEIARRVQNGALTHAQAQAERAAMYERGNLDERARAAYERYYAIMAARPIDPTDTTRRALAIAVALIRDGQAPTVPAWVKSNTHRHLFVAALIAGANGCAIVMPQNHTARTLAELTGETIHAKCVSDFWRRGKAHGFWWFESAERTGTRDPNTGALTFDTYARPTRLWLAADWCVRFSYEPAMLRAITVDPVLCKRIEDAANGKR